jgi:phosphoenolpyruvate synthase/pyruvate phosphate dikinase
MRDKIIFLCEKIAEALVGAGHKELWPLHALQSFTYFDASLTEDMMKVFKILKQKYSLEEIASMIDSHNQIISHFCQNAITGAKELRTLNKIEDKDIDEHLGDLIKIIEIKSSFEDITKGKNILQNIDEIRELNKKNFIDSKEEDKRSIGIIRIMLMALIYSVFSDYFTTTGQIAHGPYELESFKGKKAIIYHFKNLKPLELHQELENMPFKEVKIITIRNTEDIGFNIIMQQIGDFSPKTIEKHYIEVDGKETTIEEVLSKLGVVQELTKRINEKVNKLEGLDKVRLLGKIAQYNLKVWREKAYGEWHNPQIYEKKISKFGNFLIEKNKPEFKEKLTKEYLWPFYNPYLPFDDFSDIFKEQIQGVAASSGRAIGKAIIIKNNNDINRVANGDIMVAKFTEPFMTPAMTKAIAIVTDYGGITAHAAIISRELGIPCIVGTEIATEKLKDGEVVFVDAEKGIVYFDG